MFGVGLPELAVIALIGVLVFGPDRLPELARQAARALRRGRRITEQLRDDLRSQLGPEYSDLELRDLDPRTLVRKHVLEALEDDGLEDDELDADLEDDARTRAGAHSDDPPHAGAA